MPIAALLALVAGWSLISPFSMAMAQSTSIRQSDGTSGSLSPLGGEEAIYSDAHGNKGPTHLGTGLPSHSFSSPHGAGTVTPFGTPAPPNLVTPAPLLPLNPRGMAIPQPQAPASSGSPGGSGSFSGRPGH